MGRIPSLYGEEAVRACHLIGERSPRARKLSTLNEGRNVNFSPRLLSSDVSALRTRDAALPKGRLEPMALVTATLPEGLIGRYT